MYRTTCINSTRETLISLAFGMEAIFPSELFAPNHRTSQVLIEKNDEARSLDLTFLEEKRLEADLRNAYYKQKLKKYNNSKVRVR